LTVILTAAVMLGCFYTWEQLAVTRLLDRIEALEVTRQRAHGEAMLRLREWNEASSRQRIEREAVRLGLGPVPRDRIVVIPERTSHGE
jgi:hypothetical protein